MESLYADTSSFDTAVHSNHQPENAWSAAHNHHHHHHHHPRSVAPLAHLHQHHQHHHHSTIPDAQSPPPTPNAIMHHVPQCPPHEQRNKFWDYNLSCYQRMYNENQFGHSLGGYEGSASGGPSSTGAGQSCASVDLHHGIGGIVGFGAGPPGAHHLYPQYSQFTSSDTSSSSAGSSLFLLWFTEFVSGVLRNV